MYFDCTVLDKFDKKQVFDPVVEKPKDTQFDLMDFISKSDFSSMQQQPGPGDK